MTPFELGTQFHTYFGYTDHESDRTTWLFHGDSEVPDFLNAIQAYFGPLVMATNCIEHESTSLDPVQLVTVVWRDSKPMDARTTARGTLIPHNWDLAVRTADGNMLPPVELVSLDDIPAGIRHACGNRSVEVEEITVKFHHG